MARGGTARSRDLRMSGSFKTLGLINQRIRNPTDGSVSRIVLWRNEGAINGTIKATFTDDMARHCLKSSATPKMSSEEMLALATELHNEHPHLVTVNQGLFVAWRANALEFIFFPKASFLAKMPIDGTSLSQKALEAYNTKGQKQLKRALVCDAAADIRTEILEK